MKKLIAFLLAFSAVVFNVAAQSFEPTTSWPYAYREFVSGQVLLSGGAVKDGVYNLCLAESTVHYVDGDMVKDFGHSGVVLLRIGKDSWQNVGGRMMKIMAASEKAVVVMETSIDIATLNSTGGAYGSSSASSGTMSLSSLEGLGVSKIGNSSLMDLASKRENGKVLPLIQKLNIYVGGLCVPAQKRDVLSVSGIDKAQAEAFLKSAKIKWKDPHSVLQVADYLADTIK